MAYDDYGRGREFGNRGGRDWGYWGGAWPRDEYAGEYGRGELGRGNHAGRGPRRYQRSDERIEEDVNEQLTRHPGIDATEIDVKVSQGEVTLTGTVSDRHAKRIAEDVAEWVSGVRDVHNQLRVSRNERTASDREVERATEREGRTSREAKGTSRTGATTSTTT